MDIASFAALTRVRSCDPHVGARVAGSDTFTWPHRDGLNRPQSTTLGELDWDGPGDRISALPVVRYAVGSLVHGCGAAGRNIGAPEAAR